MGGKSTFLRQNALIAIMAQIGSFVPAASAEIGLVDGIFSRVGASDNLARGESTFMVEMKEASNIMYNATERSLIIMDEIGRGTATYDGLSIAWAVLEYINLELKCRSLFATHYHELTTMEGHLPNLACHTVKVKEWQGDIIFHHQIIAGKADRSYGLYVAKLAGLPPKIIKRAEELLNNFEQKNSLIGKEEVLYKPAEELDPEIGRWLEKIKQIDLDTIPPREAITLLYQLQESIDNKVL